MKQWWLKFAYSELAQNIIKLVIKKQGGGIRVPLDRRWASYPRANLSGLCWMKTHYASPHCCAAPALHVSPVNLRRFFPRLIIPNSSPRYQLKKREKLCHRKCDGHHHCCWWFHYPFKRPMRMITMCKYLQEILSKCCLTSFQFTSPTANISFILQCQFWGVIVKHLLILV